MESAPLTLAHTHARNAIFETRKSNPVAASEEHDLAAGEFATAAQKSADPEALRTLQLLEQHHKKLAHILRFQHEHPPAAVEAARPEKSDSAAHASAADDLYTTRTTLPGHDAQQKLPRSAGNVRLPPAREGSSIATHLASARGIIPSQPRRGLLASPSLSSQQALSKMADSPTIVQDSETRLKAAKAHEAPRDRSTHVPASKQSWPPLSTSPTDITSQEYAPSNLVEMSLPQQSRWSAGNDEPFQRFFATFEGLISKLSAPLAFAGLPLGTDAPGTPRLANRKATADTKLDRHHATSDRSTASPGIDVNSLFSRAALRSIREPMMSATGNPAESFYVVPTTGGTVSYANIVSRADKSARSNSLGDADEDFVDAHETPPSPELRQSRTSSIGKASRGTNQGKLTSLHNPKTMEELQLENEALKHLSDTLSKRLHMWEVNAQSSSLALQQSLKAMHHQRTGSPDHQLASMQAPPSSTLPPTTTAPVASTPTDNTGQRIRELEDLVKNSEKELERASRENEKLRTILGRYRERWEKLKEGAKTRRAEAKSSASAEGPRNSEAQPSDTLGSVEATPSVSTDAAARSSRKSIVRDEMPLPKADEQPGDALDDENSPQAQGNPSES